MKSKLFVRNLSWSVTEDDLYDLFSEVGEITALKIPVRREDGKSRGIAFIEMATPEQGQAAVDQLNGTLLYDREIAVTYQDENRARPGGGGGAGASSGGGGGMPPKNSKLFIRNISFEATEQDLQNLFEEVGNVVSVKIPVDRDTGAHRGFAFVEMGSQDEAEQVIHQFNNSELMGKALAIAYQDPSRARPPRPRMGAGAGGYGGGGGGGGYRRDRW